ncbi:hypothetical protein RvY_04127 [Ramazzottius varieornatus]|uniref:Uncharacterized protein n=1 Tax=Ramazzottius varieornatus TaxID=947166 RepID=A0A1D1UQJ2_RAMVA|nr:hypothetical protein RvY_04127 [Ramazzottius varieornatus]
MLLSMYVELGIQQITQLENSLPRKSEIHHSTASQLRLVTVTIIRGEAGANWLQSMSYGLIERSR